MKVYVIDTLCLNTRYYVDNYCVGRSVAVPGMVAGLQHAQQRYGSNKVKVNCCSWGDILYR